jgi:hypothetical protein
MPDETQSKPNADPSATPQKAPDGREAKDVLQWDRVLLFFSGAWFPALAFTIIFCAIFAWIKGSVGDGFAVLGIGFAVATASGTVGWLFGLLFGIPRSLARANAVSQVAPAPPPVAAASAASSQALPAVAATIPGAVSPTTSSQASPTQASAPASAVSADEEPATPARRTNQPISGVNTNLEDISDWLSKTIIGVGLTQLYAIPHAAWHYATILDTASLQGRGGGALLILSLAAAGAAGAFWIGYALTRTVLTALFEQFERH